MALSTLVRATYVKNLDGLLGVWTTLFGNVSRSKLLLPENELRRSCP